MGIGTPWKAAWLLAVGAAGGAAAVAVASVPDGNGVIHACVELQPGTTLPTTVPNLRVIDPGSTQTCSASTPAGGTSEASIAWNTAGPQGQPGTPGTPGSPGTPGRSATVVGGNTLTIGGGQVITVGNAPTLTVISPAVGNRSIATLSFTGGIKTDILSYSLAAKTGSSGGSGGGSGKVALHDIQITKLTDKSSPKLFLACANGQHFKTGTLVVRKAGGTQLTYTLSDVLIASAQSTGHGDKLVDSLTLNYAKLKIQTAKAHA